MYTQWNLCITDHLKGDTSLIKDTACVQSQRHRAVYKATSELGTLLYIQIAMQLAMGLQAACKVLI